MGSPFPSLWFWYAIVLEQDSIISAAFSVIQWFNNLIAFSAMGRSLEDATDFYHGFQGFLYLYPCSLVVNHSARDTSFKSFFSAFYLNAVSRLHPTGSLYFFFVGGNWRREEGVKGGWFFGWSGSAVRAQRPVLTPMASAPSFGAFLDSPIELFLNGKKWWWNLSLWHRVTFLIFLSQVPERSPRLGFLKDLKMGSVP